MTVNVQRRDAVAVLELNRPKVNAFNAELVEGLNQACAEVEGDASIRAVVLYGGRTFSAGADLEEMASGGPNDVRARVGALGDVISRVERLAVPTVAAISGYALGGGCELALGCDFRFAHTDAKIGQPEIKVGLIPGAGGTQRLPRLIGPSRAKWMIYTGSFVDTPTAKAWGLVDEATDDDVLELATERAAELATGPTLSIAAAKRAIELASLDAGLAAELDEFVGLFGTRDTQHGLESFNQDGPGKASFEGR